MGFQTLALARVGLHNLLVLLESGVHLGCLDIVEEDARAERAGNCSTELAITGLGKSCQMGWEKKLGIKSSYLKDSLGGLVEDVLGEVVVIHRKTNTREEVEKSLVLVVAEDTSQVGKSGRVSHVNGDGVTVTERRVRDQLVERRPAECRQ